MSDEAAFPLGLGCAGSQAEKWTWAPAVLLRWGTYSLPGVLSARVSLAVPTAKAGATRDTCRLYICANASSPMLGRECAVGYALQGPTA